MAHLCLLAGLPNACLQYIPREEVVAAIEFYQTKCVKEEMEPLKNMAKLKMEDTSPKQNGVQMANKHDRYKN